MLASNGYLVFGIDHTYGAMGTVFENGEEVKIDPNALPDLDNNNEFLEYADALVDTYSLDTKLVLDNVFNLNDGIEDITMFEGRIDTENIGLLGHSTGGGGIVKLAITDSRIQSIFGLDPWIEPIDKEIISKGLTIPATFLRSNQWETGPNNVNLKLLNENTKENLNIYQINGSIHLDFSMMYMFNPTGKYFGLSSNIDNDLNREIQQNYILKFFNKTLKGLDTNIDDLYNEYEIVTKVDF